MNRIYIDFDGVILDTWETIFSEYLKKYDTTEIEDDKIKRLMLDIGWENILNESKVINNNLEKLKSYGYKIIEPSIGNLACGYKAKGKLPKTKEIINYIKNLIKESR